MIEYVLYDAIKYAKRFYGNRTANKFYPDLSVLPESQRPMYQHEAPYTEPYYGAVRGRRE
jgi:hypothetical protein